MFLFAWEAFLSRLPATLAIPSERPTVEYVKDITAATIDSHHTWSKSGIWENMISVIPKVIMYPLLDMWHGSFPPLLWKQFDLFIALNYTKGSNIHTSMSFYHFSRMIYEIREILRFLDKKKEKEKKEANTHIMLTDAAIV